MINKIAISLLCLPAGFAVYLFAQRLMATSTIRYWIGPEDIWFLVLFWPSLVIAIFGMILGTFQLFSIRTLPVALTIYILSIPMIAMAIASFFSGIWG